MEKYASYERGPSGFWEWVLSWFGWQFQEVVREIHLDLLRSLFLLVLIVTALVVSVVSVMGVVTLVSALIRGLWKKTLWLISSASYGLGYIFRLLASSMDPGDLYRVVLPPVTALAYNTESIRPNSALTKFDIPPSQVLLGTLSGDRFVAHGCGVRVDVQSVEGCYIVTALHVYQGLSDDFAVRGKTGSISVSKNFLKCSGAQSPRECIILDTDVCAFPLSANEASRIGVSKSTIVGQLAGTGTLARIVGPTSEGSTGVLREDVSVFGRLIYDGSTVAGFSGAGYIVGSSVAGVHAAGGVRNVGYSLRLAYVTLLYFLRIKQEDTSDWLRDVITKKKKKVYVDLTWAHLDSKRIKVNGEYHIIDKDDWHATVGKLEIGNTGYLEYDDSERVEQSASGNGVSLASKNQQRPAVAPGSSTSIQSSQGQPQNLQSTITALARSLQSLEDRTKAQCVLLKKISGGQTAQPAVSTA